MEYHEVINGRRSTRGFLDKPVSVEVLKEVIELAVRAPSSMNTQPWHFHIVTGEVLDNIRRENTKRNVDGVPPSREIKSPLGYQGKHRERQVEIAIQLFQEMGIERDDAEGRQDWVLRGFRQFDAPVAIIVTFDEELKEDDISKFDCGAAVNGLVNAGWSKGLGAVINSQGIMQSPVVREYAKIPDNQIIMICVAMGYPDEEFPANKVISKRRPIEEVATFHGF
jgi:nitroreductase|tara:strand:- start:817 stop:1488 length:672 start_codon:yes stop_codon:yes gene_type:complete